MPEEFREIAVAGVPWKTEAELYRTDFAQRLPEGLTAPRAVGVFDLDPCSSAIWIEEVPARAAVWDRERYERAAHLLGRLAASRALATTASLRAVDWSVTVYAEGRIAVQIVPMLLGSSSGSTRSAPPSTSSSGGGFELPQPACRRSPRSSSGWQPIEPHSPATPSTSSRQRRPEAGIELKIEMPAGPKPRLLRVAGRGALYGALLSVISLVAAIAWDDDGRLDLLALVSGIAGITAVCSLPFGSGRRCAGTAATYALADNAAI